MRLPDIEPIVGLYLVLAVAVGFIILGLILLATGHG